MNLIQEKDKKNSAGIPLVSEEQAAQLEKELPPDRYGLAAIQKFWDVVGTEEQKHRCRTLCLLARLDQMEPSNISAALMCD